MNAHPTLAVAPILAASFFTSTQAAPFDTFRDCDHCPEMIELPLGDFLMGAPEAEAESTRFYLSIEGGDATQERRDALYQYQEGPIHPVQIDIAVAMGRNEVTYDQWMTCVAAGGCRGHMPDPTVLTLQNDMTIGPSLQATGGHPVMRVSYVDALAYTEWLNRMVGQDVYRLPTEAEWEYAARAGTQTPYAQGEDVTQGQVNFSDQTTAKQLAGNQPDYIISSLPVPVDDMDAANAWGLRHMSGNIAEFTMSCWSDRHELWSLSSIYLEDARERSLCKRVVRGGAYDASKSISRAGSRWGMEQGTRLPSIGFRVVRELTE